MINQRCGLFVALLVVLITSSACGLVGSTAPTPATTRNATQTPWIIYVPVTSTPQPPIATPFPTVTLAAAARATATRTPTRVAPAATKPAAAVPTKAAAATVPAVVQPTPVPACSLAGVKRLLFPKDGDPRTTKESGPGSDTFRFQWEPFQAGETDPQTGYRIDIASRRGNTQVNGDQVYVSHNWFVTNGQTYIYSAQRVYGLAAPAGGDNVTVTWSVTVVKTSGSFDNQGSVTGTVAACSPPSPTSTIVLNVIP